MGQIENLEPYTKAVNDAAARVRGLWLGYIALLAYLFIAVFAVTHRDLLLENPVKLPILNVELPMVGFFFVAPGFFLINHFYLLLQLKGLSRRIREFNDEISNTALDKKTRWRERRRLDTFVVVQMLGGTREERERLTGWFLKLIALITLVFAPVALLLTIQLQFLPYQHEQMSWWHRAVLSIDLGLLLVFWPAIRQGEWASWRATDAQKASAISVRGMAAGSVILFSSVFATVPGEFADCGCKSDDWNKPTDSLFLRQKQWFFGTLPLQGEAGLSRINRTYFSRAMVIPDNSTLVDLEKFDKIRRRHRDNKDRLNRWQTDRTLSLRGRNLRGAVLDRSDLRNIDLYGANLRSASLEWTNLRGASLERADLRRASLDGANLEGSSLEMANLQGASLNVANLQGALLNRAELQGASLEAASLQGAWLVQASLQGASLFGAYLQGTSLEGANLQGVVLMLASMQGTFMDRAQLQGASLELVSLQGASLDETKLQGATLESAQLWRTHGTPIIGTPPQVWIKRPLLHAMTAAELTELEKEALKDVVDEKVRMRIQARLAVLSAQEHDIEDILPPDFWAKFEAKLSKPDHLKHIANLLQKLACAEDNAPYVAQKLISFRLKDIGSSQLPQLAKKLLDAAEGRTNDCPGAIGLDATSIAELRNWARKEESRPVAPASS